MKQKLTGRESGKESQRERERKTEKEREREREANDNECGRWENLLKKIILRFVAFCQKPEKHFFKSGNNNFLA